MDDALASIIQKISGTAILQQLVGSVLPRLDAESGRIMQDVSGDSMRAWFAKYRQAGEIPEDWPDVKVRQVGAYIAGDNWSTSILTFLILRYGVELRNMPNSYAEVSDGVFSDEDGTGVAWCAAANKAMGPAMPGGHGVLYKRVANLMRSRRPFLLSAGDVEDTGFRPPAIAGEPSLAYPVMAAAVCFQALMAQVDAPRQALVKRVLEVLGSVELDMLREQMRNAAVLTAAQYPMHYHVPMGLLTDDDVFSLRQLSPVLVMAHGDDQPADIEQAVRLAKRIPEGDTFELVRPCDECSIDIEGNVSSSADMRSWILTERVAERVREIRCNIDSRQILWDADGKEGGAL